MESSAIPVFIGCLVCIGGLLVIGSIFLSLAGYSVHHPQTGEEAAEQHGNAEAPVYGYGDFVDGCTPLAPAERSLAAYQAQRDLELREHAEKSMQRMVEAAEQDHWLVRAQAGIQNRGKNSRGGEQ